MSWANVKALLRTTVATVAGVHPKAVSWKDKPDASANKLIKLDVVKAAQEHKDRKVRTYNETTGNYDLEFSTLIGFTLSVHCEDIKGEPLDLSELVRSGFAWDSTLATLEAGGVTIVSEPGQALPVPVMIDERSTEAWLFEIELRAEFHRADPVDQSTIEHVDIDGELKQGNADPAPVTVTVNVDRV